jgi:hypothetical protein
VDYSTFVILLARQRSGANALKSVLQTHPEIWCSAEILNPHPGTIPGVLMNYFRFVERTTVMPASEAITADNQEELFLAHLDFLRSFSDKRLKVLDLKYNQVRTAFPAAADELALLSFLRHHRFPVLNLTRRNYLRSYLSAAKARQRGVGHETGEGTATGDQRVEVDMPSLIWKLQQCSAENERIARSFAGYDRYLTFDYEDLIEYLGGPISERVLSEIAQWLGVPPDFPQRSARFKKLASLPLEETITNFEEIEAALRGTPFEYCLEDEWFHRGEQAAG